MKRIGIVWKIVALALALTAVLSVVALATGVDTASDPLVSLSYLTGTYRNNLLSDVETTVAAESRQLSADFSQQTADLEAALAVQTAQPAENDYETVTLSAGQSVVVYAGGEALMLSGSATVTGSGLTDATAGSAVYAGGALTANHLYVATTACTITASGSASLLVKTQA